MKYTRKYIKHSNFSKWEAIKKAITPRPDNFLGQAIVIGGLGGAGWGGGYTGYKYLRGKASAEEIPEELTANAIGGVGGGILTAAGAGLLHKLHKLK